MKNLLIWIIPGKIFIGEPLTLIKIQIDNSLDLGWKREDIILATNFEFEYNGVKSIVVSDDNFHQYFPQGSKHKAMLELFNRGFIKKGEFYWFHDLDAYQSEAITEYELGMDGVDMALADYGWREKRNTGSIFFKASAQDIFKGIVKVQSIFTFYPDEEALMILMFGLTEENAGKWGLKYRPEVPDKTPKIKDIKTRVKLLNTSYNFVPFFKLQYCYMIAIKPIKVVHFHPFGNFKMIPRLLNFYMYGDNEINTVFMSKRLIKIFHQHGVK